MSKATKIKMWEFNASILSKGQEDNAPKPPFEPPHKNPGSESAIQGTIMDYLIFKQAMGHLFVQRTNNTPIFDTKAGKYRSMSKGAHKGFPDILVLLHGGRTVFFEVKTGRGKQSEDQVAMQNRLEKFGAEYYVVRSLDYVKKALYNEPVPEPKGQLPF